MQWRKISSSNVAYQVAKSSIHPDFSNGIYTNILSLSGWDKAGIIYQCVVTDNYENTGEEQHEIQSNTIINPAINNNINVIIIT